MLYSHAPEGYICPFCLVVDGIENEHVITRQSDVIYRDEFITAFICATTWGINKGNVIIIPNRNYSVPSNKTGDMCLPIRASRMAT